MNTNEPEQYNTLIIDPGERTSILVKSILIGSDCRVSISSDCASAASKLETCLFDAGIVDLSSTREAKQIKTVLDLHVPSELPFPVGTLTDDLDRTLSPESLTIRKPVRIKRVEELWRNMKQQLEQERAEREEQMIRSSVQCQIQLPGSDEEFTCRAVTMNSRGLYAEPEAAAADNETIRFRNALEEHDGPLQVTFPGDADQLTFSARSVFTERTPKRDIRGVGLRFHEDDSDMEKNIRRIETRSKSEGQGVKS